MCGLLPRPRRWSRPVCTGSLILAGVGLLAGRPAATHWAFAKVLESLGSPYRHVRWVEHGKIIPSAGVSAGIDMALYLASGQQLRLHPFQFLQGVDAPIFGDEAFRVALRMIEEERPAQ